MVSITDQTKDGGTANAEEKPSSTTLIELHKKPLRDSNPSKWM
jgi:hypothetical protein